MAKKRLNKGRVFMTFALVVGSIIAADCIRRDYFVTPDTTIVVDGDFKNSQNAVPSQNGDTAMLGNNTQPSSQPASSNISYLGYSEFSVPASQLSSGLLTVVDQTHPAAPVNETGLVNLTDVKNEFYSLHTEDLVLNEDAAEALNRMMADYNAATGLSDFIIYSTTTPYTGENSVCPSVFPESASGSSIDLAVQGSSRVLEYDGKDEEAWIIENCANYGFIVRYPQGKENVTGHSSCVWHLRYVGVLHSSIMAQNNLCLEEYVNWIKAYTINTAPLTHIINGIEYEIYYAPYMGDITSVRVPVSGNYTISGNNIDGYIIAAKK